MEYGEVCVRVCVWIVVMRRFRLSDIKSSISKISAMNRIRWLCKSRRFHYSVDETTSNFLFHFRAFRVSHSSATGTIRGRQFWRRRQTQARKKFIFFCIPLVHSLRDCAVIANEYSHGILFEAINSVSAMVLNSVNRHTSKHKLPSPSTWHCELIEVFGIVVHTTQPIRCACRRLNCCRCRFIQINKFRWIDPYATQNHKLFLISVNWRICVSHKTNEEKLICFDQCHCRYVCVCVKSVFFPASTTHQLLYILFYNLSPLNLIRCKKLNCEATVFASRATISLLYYFLLGIYDDKRAMENCHLNSNSSHCITILYVCVVRHRTNLASIVLCHTPSVQPLALVHVGCCCCWWMRCVIGRLVERTFKLDETMLVLLLISHISHTFADRWR